MFAFVETLIRKPLHWRKKENKNEINSQGFMVQFSPNTKRIEDQRLATR
jgi:hypothetical protein